MRFWSACAFDSFSRYSSIDGSASVPSGVSSDSASRLSSYVGAFSIPVMPTSSMIQSSPTVRLAIW